MKVKEIPLKDLLMGSVIYDNGSFGNPLSFYVLAKIKKIRESNNELEIKESLQVILDFIESNNSEIAKELSNNLLHLFSINEIVKNKETNVSQTFLRKLNEEKKTTVLLVEKMFSNGAQIKSDTLFINKELLDFTVKMIKNKELSSLAKPIEAIYNFLKESSKLDHVFFDEKKLLKLHEKIEKLDDNTLKDKYNIKLVKTFSEVGDLSKIEKNADIKIKTTNKLRIQDLLFNNEKINLLTAKEKLLMFSFVENQNLLIGNMQSPSVSVRDENGKVKDILFNISPITNSVEFVCKKENIDLAIECFFDMLPAEKISSISVDLKNIKFSNKNIEKIKESARNSNLLKKIKIANTKQQKRLSKM